MDSQVGEIDDGSLSGPLASALELLERWGPVPPGIGMPVSELARRVGVSRSTLTRWWPTVAELADDVAVHTATERRGWQDRLLEMDPTAPLGESVGRSVEAGEPEPGPVVRAWVAALPDDAPARQRVAAWEWDWLHRFADWLARCTDLVDVVGPEMPWFDMAIGTTAYLEGFFLAYAFEKGEPLGVLDHLWARRPGEEAVPFINSYLAGASVGPGQPATPADGPTVDDAAPTSDARTRLLARIESHLVEAAVAGDEAAAPGRIVDIERLARARKMTSSRSLYARWPSASSMNADLARAVVSSHLRRIQELYYAASRSALVPGPEELTDLMVGLCHDAVTETTHASARRTLGLFAALGDPAVSAAASQEVTGWLTNHEHATSAALLSLGTRLGEHENPTRYLENLLTCYFGSTRLAAMHPGLIDRTLGFDGADRPVLAVAIYCAGRACDPAMDVPRPTLVTPRRPQVDATSADGSGDPPVARWAWRHERTSQPRPPA